MGWVCNAAPTPGDAIEQTDSNVHMHSSATDDRGVLFSQHHADAQCDRSLGDAHIENATAMHRHYRPIGGFELADPVMRWYRRRMNRCNVTR